MPPAPARARKRNHAAPIISPTQVARNDAEHDLVVSALPRQRPSGNAVRSSEPSHSLFFAGPSPLIVCSGCSMRRRFKDQNCSIAQSLEVLGDWWTLLVVREAFVGSRRFADFKGNLDISKNILSARLEHLVAHGVLARVDAGVHGTRYEYELTPMGKDLATLMTALQQWGDRWI